MTKITVIGAGAWGTAVANHLAHNGHSVTLWCNEEHVAHAIKTNQCNPVFLADAHLHHGLTATHDLAAAIFDANVLVEAIPVMYVRNVLERAKPHVAQHTPWIILSKGIEQKTDALPSKIVQEIMGTNTTYAVVGGPNFAKELVQHQFTATMIASHDTVWAHKVATLFNNKNFITHISNDPIGVQLCGALKNIIALLVGIAHGEGHGHNTGAYLITQGLAEIAKILAHPHFKADPATAYSLAGIGDLVLTCTGTLSKNLRAGILLGKGVALTDITQHMPVLPEGINTTQSLHQIIKKTGIHVPLLEGVYQIVFEGKNFEKIITHAQI